MICLLMNVIKYNIMCDSIHVSLFTVHITLHTKVTIHTQSVYDILIEHKGFRLVAWPRDRLQKLQTGVKKNVLHEHSRTVYAQLIRLEVAYVSFAQVTLVFQSCDLATVKEPAICSDHGLCTRKRVTVIQDCGFCILCDMGLRRVVAKDITCRG